MAVVTQPSTFAKMRRRLFRRKLVPISIGFILVLCVAALLAPVVAPYSPTALNVMSRLQPPNATHWLGTDGFGRDILSRLLYGARLSLLVSFLVVIIATVAGVIVGVAAGFFKRLDGPLMRINDALMSFPEILLAIALMSVLGASVFNVVLSLSLVYMPRVARIARASTMVVAEMQYAEAARGSGASILRILAKHIVPNIGTPVIVQATFVFAYTILAESSLSFLGVGVPPELPTWGNMINEGRPHFAQADWLMLFPGAAIVLTVVMFQTLGDGLRDMLDPKLRDVS